MTQPLFRDWAVYLPGGRRDRSHQRASPVQLALKNKATTIFLFAAASSSSLSSSPSYILHLILPQCCSAPLTISWTIAILTRPGDGRGIACDANQLGFSTLWTLLWPVDCWMIGWGMGTGVAPGVVRGIDVWLCALSLICFTYLGETFHLKKLISAFQLVLHSMVMNRMLGKNFMSSV